MTTAHLPLFTFAQRPTILPEGYIALPLTAEERGACRVCVVVKAAAGGGGGGGTLIDLRRTLDARVVLACLADRAGKVREWLELWIQETGGIGQTLAAFREAMTNGVLDRRWAARALELGKDPQAGVLTTGFEESSPGPIFVVPTTGSGDVNLGNPPKWALCTDEGLLASKGAPSYEGTLYRHVYQPSQGAQAALLPVDLADARSLGYPSNAVAVSPQGGRLMVKGYAPLSFDQYVSAVGGLGSDAGESEPVLNGVALSACAPTKTTKPGGWLNLSPVGAFGRLAEVLHLKLMALSGAASSVRRHVEATRAPLLNVTSASFRVNLGDGTGALPLWWTARTELADPGEAATLDLPGTKSQFYIPAHGGAISIFAPAAMGRAGQGKGWLRLRNILSEGDNGVVLEGTLNTQDRLNVASQDLLALRFGVGAVRVDLYASLEGDVMAGEVRLRTLPQRLSPEVVDKLRAAMGVPVPDVAFELLPMLSTPCDLYALGVVGVRTLLTGKGRSLPMAMDEVLSLGARAGALAGEGGTLEQRIEAVLAREPKLMAAVGPQWLSAEGVSADVALLAVPPKVWCGVLAMLVRCFSGAVPDARAKDLGDAPPGAPHRVFDGLLEDLYALLVACRSLIVSDAAVSHEVRDVLRECLAKARS